MSVKVFISYDLAPGVTKERYAQWSREVDQPLASRQPGVLAYEIYWIDGVSAGEPPGQVMEVIEAESWEAWQRVNEYPEMKEAVASFFEIARKGSIRVSHGTRIEPSL
jgi:hypothetical protein